MEMNSFNVSATLNVFRLLVRPGLCLPQATVSNFNRLPIPLSKAFGGADIRAVVLDKDDCFAVPKTNVVYEPYEKTFAQLRETYPGARLLIVSNSSGTSSLDPTLKDAQALTANTGVHVLSHSTKKPGCGVEIMEYFKQHPETEVTHPSQIAVVGDRLTTDVMMANSMGAYAVWIRDGVVPMKEKSLFARLEYSLADFLTRRGFAPPTPQSPFEK